MKIKNHLFLLILFFLTTSVLSQKITFRYSELAVEDGMSNNSVSTILQDSKGFMWFGTYYGLNRYNGYEFENFYSDINEPHSLSSNFVTALLEDKNGDIWVGTKMGLNRFDKDSELFSPFVVNLEEPASLTNNQIGALLSDSRGNLWIGTMGGGLHLYHENVQGFSCYAQFTNKAININQISALTEGYEGGLWVGTYGNGLSFFNPREPFFINYDYPTMQINDLLDDGNGSIWIATDNMGMYRFDKEMKVYEKLHLHPDREDDTMNIIMSLSLDKMGNILASVDGGGVVIVDPNQRREILPDEEHDAFDDLDTRAIYRICIDSNGLYWICTIGKGIRVLNMDRNRFYYYVHSEEDNTTISDNAVISMLQDSRQRIWVGTDGGGINLFDPEKGEFKSYGRVGGQSNKVIKRIFEDDKQQLWLGTYGGGLVQFDPVRERFESYNPVGYINDEQQQLSVWSIVQQKKGKLWVGSLGNGLFEFDITGKIFTPLSELFPDLANLMNGYILSMLIDSNNNLWIGTSNAAYVWFAGSDRFARYFYDEFNNSGVGANAIISIFEDNENNMWFGSNGGGLRMLNPESGEVIQLTEKDGLAQDQVYKVIQDYSGHLWFATHGGISKYDFETGRFQNYDSRDGLSGSAFSSVLLSDKGQVFVGGVKGLNVFNPSVIKINSNIPRVIISGLNINNLPVHADLDHSPLTHNITETDEIVLKYNQNNIGLEFVAINYFISEKNSYSYILENSSENWSQPVTNRSVKYNNLKPGNYVFKVKAANNDGYWSKERELKIRIKAPWWKTWYAFVSYFVLLAGIIFAYIRYSLMWMDLRRKLEFEVMERDKIKELNQMRLQFFTNISHEFRTPLTLILGPLDSLKKNLQLEGDNQALFNVVHKNANILLRLINQLLDFRKVQTGSMELDVKVGDIVAFSEKCALGFKYMANEKSITFKVQKEVASLVTHFDEDVLEKVIYNLLVNAFKYGHSKGHVDLILSQEECKVRKYTKPCFILKVIDDGPGIPSDNPQDVFIRYKQFKHITTSHQPGTGIGLALTKSLVELHGGMITVESEKDKGSTFSVYLPIKEVNLSMDDANTYMIEEVEENTFLHPEIIKDRPKPDINIKKKYKLLVVDDNEEVVSYLESLLGPTYFIEKAYDGEQAMEIALRRSFDLVITDVMMPKKDGIELCHELKNNIQTSHVPVIILSARSSVESRIEGLKTGADAYVPKPFNPDLLEAYIENLLQSREKLKEIFVGNSIVLPSDITSTSVDEKFVGKAMDVVKANMADETFSVEDLGQELNMSRSNLHRKMKALTGKSTTDFIRTIRLKEAAGILVSTDDQVSEIAYKVGFNSSSYFIKSFKKEFNMSPGQYKQLQQKWK